MVRLSLLCAAAALSTAALAQPNAVALDSTVKVEKVVTASGARQLVLETPKTVVPGDKLVFQTAYRNGGASPASRFVVTNPVPGAVAWTGEGSAGVEASVDGGKSFAPLPTLKVRTAAGQLRAAEPADVTHLRWTVATIAPGGTGQLSYRGIVR